MTGKLDELLASAESISAQVREIFADDQRARALAEAGGRRHICSRDAARRSRQTATTSET
jgi:hypothetical protein